MDKVELRRRVDQLFKETEQDTSGHQRELKLLLKEAERIGDIYMVGKLNMMLSFCWFDSGNRNSILPPAVKAVNIFEKLHDRKMIALSRNLLGLAYRAQGNYLFAIENYNHALAAIRGVRKPVDIDRDVIRNNIAECYYLMGEYKKSIRILKECYAAVCAKRPDDHMNAVVYAINLSDNYESLNQLDAALEILDRVQPDVSLLERDVLLWGYYARRCCVLYKIGSLGEAEQYADLTIASIRSGYDSYEFHRDFEKIALLEIQTGDFRRAQCFADILTAYAKTNKHTIDQIIPKRVQARICDARGEAQEALTLFRALNVLYEKRTQEQHEMQYGSQKHAEDASREIGKLLQRVRLSEEKAERDPLTGLMNRSAMVTVTEEFIDCARKKGGTIGAIFLDIDFFKQYNDCYGHATGDEVIKCVARICHSEENASVRFFRYGGDEFFGIVRDHKDCDLGKIALRISEAVRASGYTHEKNGSGRCLTVSIGIVNIDTKKSESSIVDVIKYADKALYHAKDCGKNVVVFSHNFVNGECDFLRVTAE